MAQKFPLVPSCLRSRPLDCCVRQGWFLRGNHHLGGSRYATHLRSWLGAGWDLDDFHVVRFEDLLEPGGLERVYVGVLGFLGLPTAPARNLTAAESRPANRRSVAPYNVSADAYRALVAAVEDDVVDLETLLGRDFGWRATWAAQLAQCDRDGGSCRLSLLPGAVR